MAQRFPTRPATMFQLATQSGGGAFFIPNPDTDSGKLLISTLVNSGRNSLAVVTAQKIGRDQDKVELSWNFLTKEEWERMLRFWNTNFYFRFTYYSPVAGSKISRIFYVGDREGYPLDIDENAEPIAYVNCKANVIDTGQ